jgi:hypothetical protein
MDTLGCSLPGIRAITGEESADEPSVEPLDHRDQRQEPSEARRGALGARTVIAQLLSRALGPGFGLVVTGP